MNQKSVYEYESEIRLMRKQYNELYRKAIKAQKKVKTLEMDIKALKFFAGMYE